MHNNTKIAAIIIGLILAIALVIGGFFLFQSRFGRAEGIIPQDVTVIVDETCATMKWTTAVDTLSIIHSGTSITALNLVDYDKENATPTKDHTVKSCGQASGTTIYFEICPEKDNCLGNGDIPWSYTTKTKSVEVTPKASPSATLAPKASPTPTEAVSVPAIDKEAVGKAIKQEYPYWDIKCTKEYPANLCAEYMPRVTATQEQKAKQ